MAAASSLLPVTELANELTDEIDAQGAEGFARTFRRADVERLPRLANSSAMAFARPLLLSHRDSPRDSLRDKP